MPVAVRRLVLVLLGLTAVGILYILTTQSARPTLHQFLRGLETRFRNEEDLAIIRILRPTIAPEIDSGIEEKAVAVRAIRKWVVNGNSLIGLVGAGNAEEDYLLLKGPRPTFGFFLQIRRDAAGWYVDNLGMFR